MPAIELRSISGTDQIALRGVRVRCRLTAMSQKTVVEQMFVNQEDRAIEAVYTFPLPDGAAVCAFEVFTNDRCLTGIIDESENAIANYDEAICAGHAAFMVEADRPDVFTARVGSLRPHQSAMIRLTYVAPLERVDKQIHVTFPTTLAPRYAPMTKTDPLEDAIDADTLNPPKALHVPYGLNLEVDAFLGRQVKSIASPSHAIESTPIDSREDAIRVLLSGGMTEMNRDVVLTIDLAAEHEPTAQLARGADGAEYLAVSFVPEFDLSYLGEPARTETIFVLDCSGSMQGESIRQATAALELCLRSLNPGDTFNICRFGSTFEMMSSVPLVYTQATLAGALRYIDHGAGMGGTEILAPLQSIFGTKPRAGTIRNIILITDGQVSNEPAVIELARNHRAENRIFSFGIGTAASSFLVKGLARATCGAAEFVTADECIEDKVLRTFGRIASPMISEIELDWGGADVQTLAETPPVFDGDVLTIFGRVQGSAPRSVSLKCRAGGRPMSWTVAVPPEHDDNGLIATLWARRAIQSLEEVNDIQRHPRGIDSIEARQQVLRLSKQFNLLSSLTTFIAIEHRSLEDREQQRPALRRVPVMLARGWGGIQINASTAPLYSLADAAAPRADIAAPRAEPDAVAFCRYDSHIFAERTKNLRKNLKRFLRAPSGGGAHGEQTHTLQPDELRPLLAAQAADGWFQWNPQRRSPMSQRSLEWRPTVAQSLGSLLPEPVSERVIDTALVLVLFRKLFASRKALWRRASAKAERWLAGTLGIKPKEIGEFLDALAAQISS
ncbi:MAG: VIT domain-containing protein [Tepidisphaeraceae bacterium]